eukprot:scaffold75378_cov63-Phaeocystis_antarctica.AAC.3
MRPGPVGADARAGRLAVCLGGDGRQRQQSQRGREAAEAELHSCASSGSKLLVAHLLELGWMPGAGLCVHRRPADNLCSAPLRS